MLEGQLLNERYLVQHSIGGGGMAIVYAAHDRILDREVAIKILRLEYTNDLEFIERFDREAQAASSLSHPNVVNIYDIGEDNDVMFIVMELVKGLTLKEYIQKYGPLSVNESVRIMIELTAAINHAHENDLIHRDIKPQNILIDENGTVKVTDFGIAIALSATALTQTNSVLGSVHYLSPEQARGGNATKKSDIYSLGIVFYELLTGELAFSGETAISVALKHLQNTIPSVRKYDEDIPQSVENIIKKSTDKDPLARYSSVAELENALVNCLNPDKLNEAPYESLLEVGEETKAIPLYNQFDSIKELEETKLVNDDDTTKHNSPVTDLKKKPKMKRWKKILIVFLISALVIGVGISAFILLKPKYVEIPDVTGLDYDEARETLENLNLETERQLIYSDEVDKGLIVKTEPQVNQSIKEDTSVTLFVSDGLEPIKFKDYVGKAFDEVEKELKELGFTDVIKYEKTSDEAIGSIINHIQPNKDKVVVPNETSVIFEVSQGPDTIILDDFIEKNKDVFIGYAKKHNLKYDITKDYSDTVAKNDIIAQSPSPGSNIEVGSEISIIVSKGEKEIETNDYEESIEVPFEPEDDEEEQEVVIYIDDLDNKLTDVYKKEVITKDTEFKIKLKIEEDKNAEYKIERDGDEFTKKTISYKEGS